MPMEVTPDGKNTFIIAKRKKSWEVSFDIKPLRNVADQDRTVLRLTKDGKGIIAIWIKQNTLKLFISATTEGDPRFKHTTNDGMHLNVYTSVTIRQRQRLTEMYEFSVEINGTLELSTYHSNATEYDNMFMYYGDPWNPSATADNVVIKNTILRNLLLGKIQILNYVILNQLRGSVISLQIALQLHHL